MHSLGVAAHVYKGSTRNYRGELPCLARPCLFVVVVGDRVNAGHLPLGKGDLLPPKRLQGWPPLAAKTLPYVPLANHDTAVFEWVQPTHL